MKESIKKWLNTKSEFYSKICEFEVTRGMVIRTNLIVIVFVAFVMIVESYPEICILLLLMSPFLFRKGR